MSVKCPKCKNDIWQVIGDTAECSNCLYTRPFHRRSGHSGEMTPSQIGAIEKIKNYFSRDGKRELYRFDVTFQDETGYVFVNVDTDEHIFVNQGGHFVIKRRGALRVLSVSDFGSYDKHDEQARHYANMLGGKVGW